MKKLITIYFIFFVICGSSQTTIQFEVKGGKPQITSGNLNNNTLPLTLNFSKDFKGMSVEFWDPQNKGVISLNGFKFGDANLPPVDNKNYKIIIGADGTLNVDDESGVKEHFILHINGKSIGTINFPAITKTPPPGTKDNSYKTGYVYYDALQLNQYLKASDADGGLVLLKNYGITDKASLELNPFLKIYSDQLFPEGGAPQGVLTFGSATGSGSGLGMNIIAGVAQYIADRAEQELSVAFFQQMKEQFGYFPELRTLFPETYRLLMNIETYSYATVLQSLKEAFERDMQDIYLNAYDLSTLDATSCQGTGKELTACQDRMKAMHSFFSTMGGRWVALALYTMQSAKAGITPAELLNNMAESQPMSDVISNSTSADCLSYNLANAIKLTDLVSQSFLKNDSTQVWVSAQDISKLFQGDGMPAFRIYMGLLYQELLNSKTEISFYLHDEDATTSLAGLMVSKGTDDPQILDLLNSFKTLIQQISFQFNTANVAFTSIKSANNKSSAFDPLAIFNYYKVSSTLVKQILSMPLLTASIPDIQTKGLEVLSITDPAINITYDIYAKKYSSVFWDAMSVFTNVNTAVEDGLFGSSASHSMNSLAVQKMVKYGTFISSLATAQNPDEVKKAIAAAALPVGSASIKKNTRFSIEVNAYVGGYWGEGFYKGVDSVITVNKNKDTSVAYKSKRIKMPTYGLYAPIGISFNEGIKCANNNNSAISLFVQLVDVGALVNFYLKNGDTATMPSNVKIRLIDIFAPGVQLGYAIPRVPLALMGGVQFIPILNQIGENSATSQTSTTFGWRAHISLVVDIPMFNAKVWDYRKSSL